MALEKRGIGWTMWDYSSTFGLVTKQQDAGAKPDEAIVRALGRTMPPSPSKPAAAKPGAK